MLLTQVLLMLADETWVIIERPDQGAAFFKGHATRAVDYVANVMPNAMLMVIRIEPCVRDATTMIGNAPALRVLVA